MARTTKPAAKPTRPGALHDPRTGVPGDPAAPMPQPTAPTADREAIKPSEDDKKEKDA